jgi:hypothetical protein
VRTPILLEHISSAFRNTNREMVIVTDARDPGTGDLLASPKRPRGRPKKLDALTSAERQSRYRQGCRTRLRGLALALAACDAGTTNAVPQLVNQVRAVLESKPRNNRNREESGKFSWAVRLIKGLAQCAYVDKCWWPPSRLLQPLPMARCRIAGAQTFKVE